MSAPDLPVARTTVPAVSVVGAEQAMGGSLQALETLPEVLLGLLERRYLSTLDPSRWRTRAEEDDAMRPVLREVRSVGLTPDAEFEVADALNACHGGGHSVNMTLAGSRSGHRLFLGARRSASGATVGTEAFLDGQASALRSMAPGLVLGASVRLDGRELPAIEHAIREAPACAVLTGVPSPVTRGEARPGLERLAAALAGESYVLQVCAEPLGPEELDRTIDECLRLRGAVHGLIRRNVGQTRGDSESHGTSTIEQEDEAQAEGMWGDLRKVAAFCDAAGVVLPASRAAATLLRTASGAADQLARGDAIPGPPVTITTSTSTSSSESLSITLLDAYAEACDELLSRYLARLQRARSGGWWRLGIAVAADGEATLERVISTLRATCSGPGSMEPIRSVRPPQAAVKTAMLRGSVLSLTPKGYGSEHPLGPAFDALATCVTTEEVAAVIDLPRRSTPGLEVREVARFGVPATSEEDEDQASVPIGVVDDGPGGVATRLHLTTDALNRHAFIGGMTGYGKTTTAMSLLTGLHDRLGIPFLVIEPVKGEYRDLQRWPGLAESMAVYTIGEDHLGDGPAGSRALPLRLNPFEPAHPNVRLLQHIDLLKAVFNAAFPMGAGMPYVLEDAILRVYEDRGWDLERSTNRLLGRDPDPEDRLALFPTLSDLYDEIGVVLEERNYGQEVHQNLGAALRSRVRSLMLSTKGRTLDTRRSVPAEHLFARPAVIELRNLGDDEEKAFVMALLLCQLYEYAEARGASGGATTTGLRHVTLIEEAHRLLARPAGPGGMESADARGKAVSMFTDLLAEMRSYGEGFLVADQVPTKLAPDVLKNSSVKILHRLTSPDERLAAGGTIDLDESQLRHLAHLRKGEAIVSDERLAAPVLVTVDRLDIDAAAAAAPRRERPGPEVADPDGRHRWLHASCARCPSPCRFRSEALDLVHDHPVGDAGAVLGLLTRGRPDEAFALLDGWRAEWSDDRRWSSPRTRDAAGLAYCAASQAMHDGVGALFDRRQAATGLAGGRVPAEHVAASRLERAVADVLHEWARSDAPGAALDLELGPPVDMPGCDACPSRCTELGDQAELSGEVLDAVSARATASTPPGTRARGVGSVLAGPGGGPPTAASCYCAVVLSVHRKGGRGPGDLLAVLRRAAEEGQDLDDL